MKAILALSLPLFLFSCTETIIGPSGPQGPQGPLGPQGAAGESGFVFEYVDVSFTSPSYDVILTYPDNFEGLDSDVALVYLLWEIQNIDGVDVEIWRPLPHSVFVEGYTLQYSFDFSKYDTRLYLDGNLDLDGLTAGYTDNFIARVVIVPGNFWDSGRMGLPTYEELEEKLGLPKFPPHTRPVKRPS